MAERTKTINLFLKIKKDWHVAATNSNGRSGGMVAMWDPNQASFKAYSFFGGILLSGRLRGIQSIFNLINIYDPYSNRKVFWDRMQLAGILSLPNLIIMGDFNSTLNVDEIWGSSACMDPLARYLNDIFLSQGLVDIRPLPLAPTWTNRRSADNFMGKRLDRVLVNDSIMDFLGGPRSSTLASNISDHMPITFTWSIVGMVPGQPFKFNRIWLEDPEYTSIVDGIWRADCDFPTSRVWDFFQHRLQKIKAMSKTWERKKKMKLRAEYLDIQVQMEMIIDSFLTTYPNEHTLHNLKSLGTRKREIMRIEEITWRLKSKVQWLDEGHQNTKYFHKCANERRNRNSIWNIKRADGSFSQTCHDIQNEALAYFSSFYTRQDGICKEN